MSLQLNAATPTLTVNATSIAFGPVVVNNSTTQTITLNSTGTAPVTVNSLSVTGSGFSASPLSLPKTLNPGQAITVTLTFNPSAVGAAAGQLSIGSNSSTNPTLAITLSGTGNPHEVELSWVPPSNSSVPVAGYNIYRALGTGSSFVVLNSMDIQTAYVDTSVQTGQTYQYYVTSVDSSGMESAPSNTTTVTIP
ncbi:MAG: choice-of-anchor D domain-containing protein [Terracidiphilus sp.]